MIHLQCEYSPPRAGERRLMSDSSFAVPQPAET
jgi:hypothetical protein